mgnify:CR=1 FL=1
MKTESEYGFVVKAGDESEEFCSHERLQKFVAKHIGKFSLLEYSSNPDLNFGSDLDIESAA